MLHFTKINRFSLPLASPHLASSCHSLGPCGVTNPKKIKPTITTKKQELEGILTSFAREPCLTWTSMVTKYSRGDRQSSPARVRRARLLARTAPRPRGPARLPAARTAQLRLDRARTPVVQRAQPRPGRAPTPADPWARRRAEADPLETAGGVLRTSSGVQRGLEVPSAGAGLMPACVPRRLPATAAAIARGTGGQARAVLVAAAAGGVRMAVRWAGGYRVRCRPLCRSLLSLRGSRVSRRGERDP